MTNGKTTKRALFASSMSTLLCISMLVGSTFAWFTDSVTSTNNIITSGNLDVVLEYKTDWNDNWEAVDRDTKLFNENALYEPGYTEVVFLRVSNAGSLDLKYNLDVKVVDETKSTNVAGDEFWLKDYLEIGYYVQDEISSGANYADILMPAMFGTREVALQSVTTTKLSSDTGVVRAEAPVHAGDDTAQIVAIVLTMPETVTNEANHAKDAVAPTITLGINLVATQLSAESDAFGTDYDKNAFFADYQAATAEELLAKMDQAIQGETVGLLNDLNMTAEKSSGYGSTGINILNGQTLDGGGNTLSVNAGGTWDSAINTTGGTIRNLTISKGFRGIFINHNSTNSSRVILENLIIDGPTYTISCDQGTGKGLTATNCTINGWTSYAATIGDVIFTDCNFGKGAGYAFCRPYAPTSFVGCKFEEGFAIDARAAITFENCTLNGVALSADNIATLVTGNTGNATVK